LDETGAGAAVLGRNSIERNLELTPPSKASIRTSRVGAPRPPCQRQSPIMGGGDGEVVGAHVGHVGCSRHRVSCVGRLGRHGRCRGRRRCRMGWPSRRRPTMRGRRCTGSTLSVEPCPSAESWRRLGHASVAHLSASVQVHRHPEEGDRASQVTRQRLRRLSPSMRMGAWCVRA
jgi:hypothetical protein